MSTFPHPLARVASRLSSSWRRSLPTFPASVAQPRAYPPRIAALILFLLPSFIQRRLRPDSGKPRHLYPTSWLDGLRGVAAFSVFLWHFIGDHYGSQWFWWPYGVHGEDDHVASSPIQLPFIRTLRAGHTMVHIFFVISGYVLSHKPLMQARKRDYDGLLRTLSSSVFRRGLRLYLPIMALTLTISMLVSLGGPFRVLKIPQQSTFGEQMWVWFMDMATFKAQQYEKNLWTIPIEFKNSLILFMVLLGLSRLEASLRLTLLSAVAFYFLRCGDWAMFDFLVGMGLAEVGLMRDARRERSAKTVEDGHEKGQAVKPSSTTGHLVDIFFAGNLVFGLFAAGWPPSSGERDVAFSLLKFNSIEPFHSTGETANFWMAVAAIQIVASTQHFEFLQAIFASPLAQYLVGISYALYLVHGSVMLIVVPLYLPSLVASVGGLEGAGMGGRTLVWLMGTIMAGIPCVWAADRFLTLDRKCVRLARWVDASASRDV